MKLSNFWYNTILVFVIYFSLTSCDNEKYVNARIITEYGSFGEVQQICVFEDGTVFYNNIDSVCKGSLNPQSFNYFIEKNSYRDELSGDLESGNVNLLLIGNDIVFKQIYLDRQKQEEIKQIFENIELEKKIDFELFHSGVQMGRFVYNNIQYKLNLSAQLYMYSYIYLNHTLCVSNFTKHDLSNNYIKYTVFDNNSIKEAYYDLDQKIFLIIYNMVENKCLKVDLPDNFIKHIIDNQNIIYEQ